MKKWIAGIVIIAILFSVITYFLIPSTLIISNTIYCKTTLAGASRYVLNKAAWKKWWVDTGALSVNKFIYKGDEYSLNDTYINAAIINIEHNDDHLKTEMRLTDLSYDSILINWKALINTSLNPIKRISDYREAVTLKKNTSYILNHLKKFIENKDNIYEIPIRLSSIDHIFLISTKKVFTHYPSTTEIYNSINFLKLYANKHDLNQTYFPMINVMKNNDTSYRLMTGLPVDKETNFTGEIHSIRMVQGDFMVTEVIGGYKTVNNALDQLQLYFQDYEKTAIAIPFQYLVTDRINELDTAKWITKIYAPVK